MGFESHRCQDNLLGDLVAAIAEQRAFLGRTRWFLWRISAASVASISGGWKGKKKKRGSVAEWSKALDLGSSLSGGVGSIPPLPAVVLTKAGRPCVYSRKVWKYCESTFPCSACKQYASYFPQPDRLFAKARWLSPASWGTVLPLWFTDYLYCCWWFESILCWSVLQTHRRLFVTATQPQALTRLGLVCLRKQD